MRVNRGLRQSQRNFAERFGIPADQNFYAWLSESKKLDLPISPKLISWNPKGNNSNCPNISTVMQFYIAHAPWQLRSVLKNTFAGKVDTITPNAAAEGLFGEQPYIAIFDGLYTAVDQCVLLWERVSRAYGACLRQAQTKDRSNDEIRAAVAKEMKKRDVLSSLEKLHALRGFLRSGDIAYIYNYNPTGFQIEGERGLSIDLSHRGRRQEVTECFVIAHELAHVILGHCSANNTSSKIDQLIEQEFATIQSIVQLPGECNASHKQEYHADMVGFQSLLLNSQYSYTMDTDYAKDAGPDKSRVSILLQCLDGVAIACLAIYLVSTLDGISNSSSHPHPDHRLDLLIDLVQGHIESISESTSQDDIGANGPGFFERMKYGTGQVADIYNICRYTLDDLDSLRAD